MHLHPLKIRQIKITYKIYPILPHNRQHDINFFHLTIHLMRGGKKGTGAHPFLQCSLLLFQNNSSKLLRSLYVTSFLKDQTHCIKKHAGKVLGHETNFCALLSGSAFLLILQIPYHFFKAKVFFILKRRKREHQNLSQTSI